jgi:hypothetical protein
MACGCAKKNPNRWTPRAARAANPKPEGAPQPSHRIVSPSERADETRTRPPRAPQPQA